MMKNYFLSSERLENLTDILYPHQMTQYLAKQQDPIHGAFVYRNRDPVHHFQTGIKCLTSVSNIP